MPGYAGCKHVTHRQCRQRSLQTEVWEQHGDGDDRSKHGSERIGRVDAGDHTRCG